MNLRFYPIPQRIRPFEPDGRSSERGPAIRAALYCQGGSGGYTPPQQDYYSQIANTLKAELNLAPDVFGAEAQYTPQMNSLNLQNLQDFLEGSPGGTESRPITQTINGFRNTLTGETAMTKPSLTSGTGMPLTDNTITRNLFSGGSNGTHYTGTGAANAGDWVPYSWQTTNNETVNTPATPGLLSILGQAAPQVNKLTTDANTAQRAGDVADIQNLGPAAVSAINAANPGQAALLSDLTSKAREQLDAGASLDPGLKNVALQSMRGGQAARGLGMGPSDVLNETTNLTALGDQLRQERQQFAGGTVALNNSTTTAPALQMLTQLNPNANATTATTQLGMSPQYQAAPITFNPMNQYAQDLNNTNYNAQVSAGIANANAQAAQQAGIAQTGTSLLSSAGLLALAFA